MTLRTFPRTALRTGLMIVLLIQTAAAQGSGTDMTLSMTPHCTNEDRSACAAFAVLDGQHLKTSKMAAGDILDVDIVVTGLAFAEVETIESWLKYDPAVLEARSVEGTEAFSAPTPGEQSIDAVLGIVKIGGETKGTLKTSATVIARVTFRVITSTKDTEISFFEFMPSGSGKTAVNGPYGKNAEEGGLPSPPCFGDVIGCRGAPNPLLKVHPSALTVILTDPIATSASSSGATGDQSQGIGSAIVPVTNAATGNEGNGSQSSSSAVTATDAGANSTFTLLQVQGLRVTTKDTTAFLAWQALRSAETAGYNVYYGTVSGRYIQRRSVTSADSSLSIRDLALGTTYYFAVRGVNANGEESLFSQEVSVVIGKPETSTSPLEAGIVEPVTEGNPIANHDGQVLQGETGIGNTILILLLISAVTGTALAFRRQLTLTHTLSYGS